MLLDPLQYIIVLLLQGLLLLQVLSAVIFIVVLDVTEGWYFPNLIVAKILDFPREGSTLLTMHVHKHWTTPFHTL